MPPAGVRGALHEQFARIGKAVASAKRIELLELLCQGERTVESLATATGMGVTNTSQHLQVLKTARLVETRRAGTRIHYRAADERVCGLMSELGAVARARLVEVERLVRNYLEAPEDLEPITRKELLGRLSRRDVVVIDVRPMDEYKATHIRGAVSIPLAELKRRLRDLPKNALIVAYCRGPYCVLAPQALALLRARGFRARRLEDGLPEWRAAGLPIASGS
ncbi:MAG: metalloregulator ArsR/SmtB family transcription factor [Chloroflexi bacterium]|nr:metalloregulator ArsR/SmtB family transcription factor [Chloroflexota bacterium]MBI2984001.1 metalloregulator ArsR/SmtB family transcription factor [Chloroflexota bacterium]